MSAVRFVDTNVLLYAISTDPREAAKKATALKLLDDLDLGLSVQVLQEFYVQATRRERPDRIEPSQAIALIEGWLRFPAQEMTVGILRAAIQSATRYNVSYWDAAILEAARALGCHEVLSEDLSDGQNYGGVRVINPFRRKSTKRGR
jgi:predicted nucleic acid-binding protein